MAGDPSGADGAALTWPRLRDAGSGALREARLQVHYASQVAAAAGKALAPPEPDYGHTALVWLPRPAALAGPVVAPGVRAAIRPADLSLTLLDGRGDVTDALSLEGADLAAAMQWLADRLAGRRGEAVELAPVRTDLPYHPLAEGTKFALGAPAALDEITRLFAGTAQVLEARVASGYSPVRCWPHHFDIATLHVLDPDVDPEEARSIGFGMTPGDAQYPDPYWYVTPWPYPDPDDLDELPVGGWHTEGWVGGVLHGRDVVPGGDQRGTIEQFFSAASAASARALGA